MDSESGITRLYTFLACKKVYPVTLRAASVVSGIPEKQISGMLLFLGNGTKFIDYRVMGDLIFRTEDLDSESA